MGLEGADRGQTGCWGQTEDRGVAGGRTGVRGGAGGADGSERVRGGGQGSEECGVGRMLAAGLLGAGSADGTSGS